MSLGIWNPIPWGDTYSPLVGRLVEMKALVWGLVIVLLCAAVLDGVAGEADALLETFILLGVSGAIGSNADPADGENAAPLHGVARRWNSVACMAISDRDIRERRGRNACDDVIERSMSAQAVFSSEQRLQY